MVGAPRSGTTWLQLLLYQHPDIATGQETHLFSAYLSGVMHHWDFHREALSAGRRAVGLPAIMEEEDFLRICRIMADEVLGRMLLAKPGSRLVVEKTPNHVLDWCRIRRVLPRARFIVLHRDPRAVVSSLLAASQTWGRGWAPDNALDAARYWRRHVEEGLRLLASSADTISVRYEDLQNDGAKTLSALFDWLGLDVSEEVTGGYMAAMRADRLLRARSEREATVEACSTPWRMSQEPDGFYRGSNKKGWEEALSSRDVRRVEYVASTLMDELGYPRRYPTRRSPDLGLRVRDWFARVVAGAQWRASRCLRRL